MKSRCTIPTDTSFKNYGGRGITVCSEWLVDFGAFLADVGPRPSPAHSIGRIDNNGDYEPGNVEWQTRLTQANNTRRNTHLSINGVTRTMSEWSRLTGVPIGTIHTRLFRDKRSACEAIKPYMPGRKITIIRKSPLVTVDGQTRHRREWAKVYGISEHQIQRRIDLYGWDQERAVKTPPWNKRTKEGSK